MIEKLTSYSQGAFSSVNTGEIGKGWGINPPAFFSTPQSPTINIGPTSPIFIDLYTLIDMYPINDLNFTIVSQQLMDYEMYFKMEIINNIINIIPNRENLDNDRFPNETIQIDITYENKENSGNFKILLKYDPLYIKEIDIQEIIINYETYENFKIPLYSLINGEFKKLNENILEIEYINGVLFNNLPYKLTDFIKDNNFITPTGLKDNSEIIMWSAFNLEPRKRFKIKFNRIGEIKNITSIPNIYLNFSPQDGILIDLKDYAIGETNNLVVDSTSDWDDLNFKEFINFDTNKNYITIVPYTQNFIDSFIELKSTITKRITYRTDKTSGIFNLILTLVFRPLYKNKTTYANLIPTINNKVFLLTNNDLASITKPLNLFGLIKDYYFPNKDGINYLGTKVKDFDIQLSDTSETNIKLFNTNFPKIYNTDKINTPKIIELSFKSTLYNIQKFSRLTFLEDTAINTENFSYKEIIFNVSKNTSVPINIFDYFEANLEDKAHASFYIEDKVILTPPILGLTNVQPELYKREIPLNEVISGKIIIIFNNKFINDTTFDDNGNIIGKKEIPYKINFSTEKNGIDTGLNLDIKDYSLYFNNDNLSIAGLNYFDQLFNNLDAEDLKNGLVKIENFKINPNFDIPVIDFSISKPSSLENNTLYYYVSNGNKLWFMYNIGAEIEKDFKISYQFDYTNKNNEIINYTQTLYLYNYKI